MIKSDDPFEDFDFDDAWDGDTSPVNKPLVDHSNFKGAVKSKKNVIFAFVILLIILSIGLYVFLPLFISKDEVDQTPIIKIEEEDIFTSNTSIHNNEAVVNANNIEQEFSDISEVNILLVSANNEPTNNILTPMPNEGSSQNDVYLSELVLPTQTDEIEIQEVVSKSDIKILNEDELLSKIEVNFEVTNTGEIVKQVIDVNIDVNEVDVKVQPTSIIDNIKELSLPASSSTEIKTIPYKNKSTPKINEEIQKIKSVKIIQPKWIIRAAQSGSALIYDKNSREMKSVEVNDVVHDIGRIKSIKIINGIWVIIGTLGKIEQ